MAKKLKSSRSPHRPTTTNTRSSTLAGSLCLIRFGGHLLKGGYDVHTEWQRLRKSRRARRQFDDDFKAQAVRPVIDEGKRMRAVARDLDLTDTALREWVKRARADRTHGCT